MEFPELFTQLLIDLQSVFRKNNKDLPISLSQAVLLLSIPRDGIIMSELAIRVGVDNSTLTRLIHTMDENGLIQKKRNKNDRRSTLIYLSKIGEKNVKLIEKNIDQFTNKILQNIPNIDKIRLKNDLNSLHWAIAMFKLSEN
jgi:MarR family transcriptional regulator for hemolysin